MRPRASARLPTRAPWRSLALLALLAGVLASGRSRAEAGDVTSAVEVSAGRGYRAWSLLGDVELSDDTTFLTLGYTGARPEEGTAPTHQLVLGVDRALGDHWLVSATGSLGLPKATLVTLLPERPLLRQPGLSARMGYRSLGLLLAAAYDSAGFSDVEYGFDAGLALHRYRFERELLTVPTTDPAVRYHAEDRLAVARPSLSARLLLGLRWELALRGGLSLYDEDPLLSGQFTDAEVAALERRLERLAEGRLATRRLRVRFTRDLGAVVGRLMADVNATAGIPFAPARFDVRPAVTWRASAKVRGQVSYAFTRYVAGQGQSHVLATRWTVRLGEPVRVWASVAVQRDVLEDVDAGEPSRVSSGLLTCGGEYTF